MSRFMIFDRIRNPALDIRYMDSAPYWYNTNPDDKLWRRWKPELFRHETFRFMVIDAVYNKIRKG